MISVLFCENYGDQMKTGRIALLKRATIA